MGIIPTFTNNGDDMFILELVEIYLNACVEFWTTESSAEAWTQWTQIAIWVSLRVCLPLYILTIGPRLFGIKNKMVNKWLSKGLQWTIVANVVLVAGPVLVPLAFIGALAYGIYTISQQAYVFFRRGLLEDNNRS